ncbi:MAG: hypothetical protein IH947_06590 [Bacteroidetes bacterium]|nr:hypothetical protein [Bacteroidota bacterium]
MKLLITCQPAGSRICGAYFISFNTNPGLIPKAFGKGLLDTLPRRQAGAPLGLKTKINVSKRY